MGAGRGSRWLSNLRGFFPRTCHRLYLPNSFVVYWVIHVYAPAVPPTRIGLSHPICRAQRAYSRRGRIAARHPGTLARRTGTGHSYWYRVYYPAPGKQAETLVCKQGDDETLAAMRERMEFAEWVTRQVIALRKLGFQVADKAVARVLVELHKRHTFDAGLTLVGTLGYMAWLNEYGAMSVSARTHDIDLARHKRLKLATPLPFLKTLQATGLPFTAVPALKSDAASTSVKLPGEQALRVDVLTSGKPIGATVPVPELGWATQAVPYYDYVLEAPEPAVMLAARWRTLRSRAPAPACSDGLAQVVQQHATQRVSRKGCQGPGSGAHPGCGACRP